MDPADAFDYEALVESVNALQKQITSLTDVVDALKADKNALEAKVNVLEAAIASSTTPQGGNDNMQHAVDKATVVIEGLVSSAGQLNSENTLTLGLFKAVRMRKEVEVIRSMLRLGANPFLVQEHSYWKCAFGAAVSTGQVEVVKVLLNESEHVGDVNWVEGLDKGGNSWLSIASGRGDVEVVKELIRVMGEDVVSTVGQLCNEHGGSAMSRARIRGHNDVVEVLKAQGVCVDNLATSFLVRQALSAVHKEYLSDVDLLSGSDESIMEQCILGLSDAAGKGDLKNVELFVEVGASPSALNSAGDFPLSAAAENGHGDVCEFLLAAGANLHKHPNELFVPAAEGHVTVCEALVAAGAEVDNGKATPLSVAAFGGHCAICKLFIEMGADVTNPLGAAAEHGRLSVCKLLLDAGADALINRGEVGATFNRTPLYRASYHGHEDICKLLLDFGADPNNGGNHGKFDAPLYGATEQGHKTVCEVLIAAGANVNCHGNGHHTPLWFAVRHRDKPICEILIAAGADIYHDLNGTTVMNCSLDNDIKELLDGHALISAAQHGHKTVCELLLRATSAPLNQVGDLLPYTPLYAAARAGHDDICRLLLDAGAEASVANSEGETPLHIATKMGHKSVLQVLTEARNPIPAPLPLPRGTEKRPKRSLVWSSKR